MALPAAVQGQASQEVVFLEKLAPLLVQQYSIGLDGVVDRQFWGDGLFYVGDEVPKEIQPRQSGLAPLEQEGDRALGRLRRLLDQGVAHRFRHPAVVGNRADLCLVGIKAIGAAQVAAAGSGLQQNAQGRHGNSSLSFQSGTPLTSRLLRALRSFPDRSPAARHACNPYRRSPGSGSYASAGRQPPARCGSPDGRSR